MKITRVWLFITVMLFPGLGRASFLHGEALDKTANIISWVVMIGAPIILIALFWMIHVLPEKIAEKKGHPQAEAIQVLCLLSLVFGGLLWPLAWLWTYTKPVMYKLAYGTDTVHHDEEEDVEARIAKLQEELAQLTAGKTEQAVSSGDGEA